MIEIIVAAFALTAGAFSLIAALGICRFPDALSRMHAASKVGTFAASLALIAAAIHIGTVSAATRSLLAIVFLLLTAPIGAHLLGRAAAWRSYRLTSEEGDNSKRRRSDLDLKVRKS
ncbi:monovalent cation/H(+) antiporter subunit G [Brucella thiophenivorans]|uniref:monovalent cation/H(+) antiporter subunit G n=1 Tax=Brucella thiophenivorans TaxID=571255 RepID=UPI000B985985|nr:monovalent cation/H(+) antiporter subunit G [Brucella thiophenivorans]